VKPAWQRWNDYGIGCLLEGGANAKRGELRQAEQAFRVVADGKDSAGHGWINLARVLIAEGRLSEAVDALNAARTASPPPPWWLVDWFTGLVAVENAAGPEDLDRGIAAFERILEPDNQPVSRGFDFSRDYVVRNRLADTIFRRAVIEEGPAREQSLRRAVSEYRETLALEPEDLDAHYGLAQCFARLAGTATSPVTERVAAIGHEPFNPARPRLPELKALLAEHAAGADDRDPDRRSQAWAALAAIHREIHALLRPDEQAIATAVSKYRAAHPEADLAAEPVPIYPLARPALDPGATAP
jgi:tetratricopeptide (TPR) repeat protein